MVCERDLVELSTEMLSPGGFDKTGSSQTPGTDPGMFQGCGSWDGLVLAGPAKTVPSREVGMNPFWWNPTKPVRFTKTDSFEARRTDWF